MLRTTIICTLVLVTSLFINSSLLAQDTSKENHAENYDLEYRTFRISLIPGISTNGIDATKYVSRYSLNLLAGYHGALGDNGFELGSLFNANKYYARGIQIAGLVNYSGEETAGVQLAGLGTYSGDEMQGIQLSGIANISGNDMQGLQLAGILNASQGYSQGLQGSGILNISNDGMQGIFGAGVGNVTGGEMQGIMLGGIFNITAGDMQGIAASGILNYATTFQGIGLSTINVAEDFQGIQLGTINIAERAEGIQLGVVNYAKEFEGVPVGLVSYYQNGRTNIDVWTSDAGFTNMGIKLGTEQVYNMISIGYNTLLDRDVWQLGWSIGRLHEYDNHFLYSDFSYFKINEGGWTRDLNSNFKYRLLLGKQINEGFKFYAGPTLNMLVSSVNRRSDYTWYRLFDFGAKDRSYIFWAGFSLGIELF